MSSGKGATLIPFGVASSVAFCTALEISRVLARVGGIEVIGAGGASFFNPALRSISVSAVIGTFTLPAMDFLTASVTDGATTGVGALTLTGALGCRTFNP